MAHPLTSLTRLLAERTGARVRELRLDAELSQSELAQRAGSHRPIIARIERGHHLSDLATLTRIARALELELGTLLAGIDWRDVDVLARASIREAA